MKKRKRGRPPFQITKQVLAKAEGFASRGMNQMQIADALGINYDTLMKYKNLNSEFLEAIKSGQAKGIAKITNALYEQAVNQGSVSASIFYLKNRAGWSDKTELEVTDKVTEIKRTFVKAKKEEDV